MFAGSLIVSSNLNVQSWWWVYLCDFYRCVCVCLFCCSAFSEQLNGIFYPPNQMYYMKHLFVSVNCASIDFNEWPETISCAFKWIIIIQLIVAYLSEPNNKSHVWCAIDSLWGNSLNCHKMYLNNRLQWLRILIPTHWHLSIRHCVRLLGDKLWHAHFEQ